jgi:hypothetical protein
MKIRIDGLMATTNDEELSAEASAYISGMYQLATKLKPLMEEMIPEPAFLMTSNGNSFFAYTERDNTRIGDGRKEPALCCQVIWNKPGTFTLLPDVIEFEACRAEVNSNPGPRGFPVQIIGTFGFTGDELRDVDALLFRFRNVLKAMLFRGAWGGPRDVYENPKLTANQREALSLSTSTGG